MNGTSYAIKQLHVAVQLQVSIDHLGGVWDHGKLVLANLWDGIWAMLKQA